MIFIDRRKNQSLGFRIRGVIRFETFWFLSTELLEGRKEEQGKEGVRYLSLDKNMDLAPFSFLLYCL